jgi:hypothetical protein
MWWNSGNCDDDGDVVGLVISNRAIWWSNELLGLVGGSVGEEGKTGER